MLDSGNLLYIVRSIVDPKIEQEWNLWHTDSHIPAVLKQPGFLKATKFRLADSTDGQPEYWTIYEMQDLRAFHEYEAGEAAKKLRAEHDAKFGFSMKLERIVLVKTAELNAGRS